ncbi:HAD family hydrolase [Calditrichota bacterium LG25]
MISNTELLKRLQKTNALILDMDGVLVDTEPLHMEAFARFLDALKLPYDNDFLYGFIGFSVPDNIRKIYNERLNITDETVIQQGIKQRDAIYLKLLESTPLHPLPGIEELVDYCRQKQFKLGVASSSDREQIEVIFKNLKETTQGRFDPQNIFSVTLSGEDVKNRKPDPEIYRKACQLLQEKAENCLTIEDSPAGVSSALAAGLTCIALKSHFVPPEKLTHAHALIEKIGQVTDWLRQAQSD